MSTHMQGLSHFLGLLHHFVMAKLSTSSMRVNCIVVVIIILIGVCSYCSSFCYPIGHAGDPSLLDATLQASLRHVHNSRPVGHRRRQPYVAV